ncbi:MAG: hypothetical protein F6J94_09785 [Moorea sp. SIO1F2]|uniref:hypothetical protein n=1 Tax=unclassified Moorena TaxID=2683338 RepID=UPI0013B91818|nr:MULTISPECIES: hypothetical protein [unclassified Moorena]NEO01117.1 hypothetical protein [Moorena sp. SIO3I7]NEO08869.1 hypothetical protein [Moorena sp. SIO3I8]NEP24997.1 hypothetical protein [Moorena sp. SIO3I6]NET82213.1 hypothetical protein [Moorena sp. SIO1F2]
MTISVLKLIVIVVEGKVKISFDSLLPTPYSLLPTPLANQNCNLYLTCTSLNT